MFFFSFYFIMVEQYSGQERIKKYIYMFLACMIQFVYMSVFTSI